MGLLDGVRGKSPTKHIEFLSSTFDRYQEDSTILASETLKKKVVTSIRGLGNVAISKPLGELDGLRAQAVLDRWALFGYFTAATEEAKRALVQVEEALSSSDPTVIAHIARTEADPSVREAAVRHVTDQTVLAEIARTDDDDMVVIGTLEKLTDQTALAELATSGRVAGVRIGAIGKLDDQELVEKIASGGAEGAVPLTSGAIGDVRSAATNRLRTLRGQ